MPERAYYILLRCPPGDECGIYFGDWPGFVGVLQTPRLPAEGYYYRKKPSRDEALAVWKDHGHTRDPPHYVC